MQSSESRHFQLCLGQFPFNPATQALSDKVASERFGHSNLQTTLSVYQHVEPDQFPAPRCYQASRESGLEKEPVGLKTNELVNRGGLEPPTR